MNLLTSTLFLKEIRRIAILPDNEAFNEIETLLKLLKSDETAMADEDDDDEREQVIAELKDFEEEIAAAKRELAEPIESDTTIINLRDTADDFSAYWESKELKVEFSEKIIQLKKAANEVADQLERAYLLTCLDTLVELDIRSQIGAYDLMNQLDAWSKKLKQAGILTPDAIQKIRAGKERAAWFRAKKKIDDADIAEAAGKRIRGPKMRDEARAMLKQDWKRAFKTEPVPTI